MFLNQTFVSHVIRSEIKLEFCFTQWYHFNSVSLFGHDSVVMTQEEQAYLRHYFHLRRVL